MSYVGAIAILILTPVLWILSHKYFRFIYFGNIGNAILKELLECFFISLFLVSVLGGIVATIFGVSVDDAKDKNSQESAVSDSTDDRNYTFTESAGGKNYTSDEQTDSDKLIAEFQNTGYVDFDDIFSVLVPALPDTFTPAFDKKETYISSLASSKPNNLSYDGYDYLLNWEYPLTFQKEREEIFEILSAIDGITLRVNNGTILNHDAFIPVEEYEYGTYQQMTPYGNNMVSTVYYGEFTDNRPTGIGVLLNLYESGVIPIYAGHFENGTIKGYGMWLNGYKGLQSEGYFDYTTEPMPGIMVDGPFDSEGPYGNIQGAGVIYYSERDAINEALWNMVQYSEDYYYDDSTDAEAREYTVISNYPVQRPRVHHEGTYELGNLREGTEYYYVEDKCYGEVKSSGSYQKDLIYTGVFRCPDGTYLNGAFHDCSEFIGGIYYPSGRIRFAGTLFNINVGVDSMEQMRFAMNYEDYEDLPYSTGTLYEEDGTIQGTVMLGSFQWA